MSLRQLPPASAPLTWRDWRCGLDGLFRPDAARRDVERSFAAALGVRFVFPVSSGRAGLTVILRALRRLSPTRRAVVIPGYTCYSVAAAVVRAGLEVVPCDLAERTFDFDYGQLEQLVEQDPPLCVVPTHLFGLTADVERVRRICAPHSVFVVEDAAQALGIAAPTGPLGTLGDVGFYSFDRGKNVTSGRGGAIVTNSPEIASEIAREHAALPAPGAAAGVRALLEMLVLSVLLRPSLFWLPASLPFLRLGETVYATDFPLRRLSGVAAGLLADWRARVAVLNHARAVHVEALRRARPDLVPPTASVCIRLPIVFGSRDERDRAYDAGRRARLGFSLMYPAAITGIPELREMMSGRRCPVSERLAECLLTVPVHPLVSRRDAQAIAQVLDAVPLLQAN